MLVIIVILKLYISYWCLILKLCQLLFDCSLHHVIWINKCKWSHVNWWFSWLDWISRQSTADLDLLDWFDPSQRENQMHQAKCGAHGASASLKYQKRNIRKTFYHLLGASEWYASTCICYCQLDILILHLMLPRNRKVHATRHAKIAATLNLTTCNKKGSYSRSLGPTVSRKRAINRPIQCRLETVLFVCFSTF